MAHSHPVYDSDPHFKIDPISRAITNDESKKIILMQNDHNSERFSFEIPKLVEGHDVTLCNQVEIHFTNSDSTKQGTNAGVYEVKDMIVDPEDENRVIFTWLVSENVTQYAGSLSFIVMFSCVENGVSVYRWNTAINNSISIARSMNNGEIITELFPDILAQWKNELFAAATGNQLISVGPIEPETYPYIWLDTSEYLGTAEKNVGYLTIKTGDGVSQRLYPVVKMDSIEGLSAAIKSLTEGQNTLSSGMQTLAEAIAAETQSRIDGDNLLSTRMDELQALLTRSVDAIAHSLSVKGVSVPEDMTIDEVAALIDGITMDIPTELQSIEVTNPPNKVEYFVGEAFDPTGMVVTANFGDGVTISAGSYMVTPGVMAEGVTEITITVVVNDVTKTTTYPVTVNGSTVAFLALGDRISIPESSGNAWYTLVDSDYDGNALLVREECLSETVRYRYEEADTTYKTKYDGNYLDTYLNDTFYNTLPTTTAELIQAVNIPTRSNADASATQVSLNRKVFALSAAEWGLEGSSLEGEPIEYLDKRSINVDYWTREPSAGMTNYAYLVVANGARGHGECNVNRHVRPAFCIAKNQLVSKADDGWEIVEGTVEVNPNVLGDGVTGTAYELAVANGGLTMTETRSSNPAQFGLLTDTVTSTDYKLSVVDGNLTMSEA